MCVQWIRFIKFYKIKIKTVQQVASDPLMSEIIYSRSNTKIIVSSYLNGGGKPTTEKLGDVIACMQATGADVMKLEIAVDSITDLAPVFEMLTHCQVVAFINFSSYIC